MSNEFDVERTADFSRAFDDDELRAQEEAYTKPGALLEALVETVGKPAATSAGTGLKFDAGKPRLDLLPTGAIFEIAGVLTYGAEKYSANTDWQWRNGMAWSRPLAAALRHIFQWSSGQDLDAESGFSHLAHAAVNLLFLLTYQRESLGKDDRCKESTSK